MKLLKILVAALIAFAIAAAILTYLKIEPVAGAVHGLWTSITTFNLAAVPANLWATIAGFGTLIGGALAGAYKKITGAINNAKQQAASAQEQAQDLETEASAYANLATEQKTQLEAQKQQITSLQAQVAEMENTKTTAQVQLDQAKQELTSYKREVSELQYKLANMPVKIVEVVR